MTDYSALVSKWSQLSPGSTQQKLDAINALTVTTGQIPTSLTITGIQLANCIAYSEFKVLTSAQQQNLLALCAISGPLLGGSANLTHLLVGMLLDYFPPAGLTIAALTAFASAAAIPWWQATVVQGGGGLTGPVGMNDLIAAGGLT